MPSITDSAFEQELNQIEMKKKYQRNSFYISASVFINRNGTMDDLEIRKCSNFPSCPDKLRDKQLHSELNEIISRITWSPIRFEGDIVNCHTIINLQVEKGRFRIIKDKNAI